MNQILPERNELRANEGGTKKKKKKKKKKINRKEILNCERKRERKKSN